MGHRPRMVGLVYFFPHARLVLVVGVFYDYRLAQHSHKKKRGVLKNMRQIARWVGSASVKSIYRGRRFLIKEGDESTGMTGRSSAAASIAPPKLSPNSGGPDSSVNTMSQPLFMLCFLRASL